MLSIIEQKMCVHDRKVWSRELQKDIKPASLKGLMDWMSSEMKSRMRATGPIRTTGNSSRLVHHLTKTNDGQYDNLIRHKCWFCKNSMHFPDQCKKVASLNHENCLKIVKENHACFTGQVAFRVWHNNIQELSSLLPNIPFVPLTATAMEATREKICHALNMSSREFIMVSPDKPNISYAVVKMSNQVNVIEYFDWLLQMLKSSVKGPSFIVKL